MPASVAFLRHRRPVDYGTAPGSTTISRRGRDLLRRFANVVQGALGGTGDAAFVINTSGTVEPAFANAAIVLASSTGTVGATVNGVALTTTWATSDTNSAGLIAGVINASTNALVQGLVTASNLTSKVTAAAVTAGDTVTVCGSTFVAYAGLPPAAVSGQNLFAFDIGANNNATATNLAAAINANPSLQRFVGAIPVSADVYVYCKTAAFPTGPGVPVNQVLSSNGTRLAVTSATLAASAVCAVTSTYPGVMGNTMTIAASGTNVTVLNTETRLNRGLAFANVLPISDAA